MIIAVTGHRDIVVDNVLQDKVDAFFHEMFQKHLSVTLLSPLAEGADQLVAEIFLKHENRVLDVPMPFSEETYLKALNPTARQNFLILVKEAEHIFEVPKVCVHPYENIGHYLVDNSDVLLALWDGTSNGKQGGTADVVSYAKSKNHTIVHLLCKRRNN